MVSTTEYAGYTLVDTHSYTGDGSPYQWWGFPLPLLKLALLCESNSDIGCFNYGKGPEAFILCSALSNFLVFHMESHGLRSELTLCGTLCSYMGMTVQSIRPL